MRFVFHNDLTILPALALTEAAVLCRVRHAPIWSSHEHFSATRVTREMQRCCRTYEIPLISCQPHWATYVTAASDTYAAVTELHML